MPQYMLLIYDDPTVTPASDTPEGQAEFAGWMSYSAQMAEAGAMKGGDALHPGDTATTVRVRGGERVVSDGPFAETKELLGGYYLIDVPDLDTALEWASKAPHIEHGSVEVRPVMVFDQG
jgi:hypothetical protein